MNKDLFFNVHMVIFPLMINVRRKNVVIRRIIEAIIDLNDSLEMCIKLLCLRIANTLFNCEKKMIHKNYMFLTI
jgi:hypothetical protein